MSTPETPAMSLPATTLPRRRLLWAAALPLLAAGCAGLPGSEPLNVNVVGLDKLQGEGFELRFAVRLRVQNPNSIAIDYDGISLNLDVNGRALASGVSPERGSVPRYGEAVISVPVSVSAVAAVRQMLGLADGTARGELPYKLRGRLGGPFGGAGFSTEGTLKLPQ
jgi:LEA14-like dessication related protein